MIVAAVQIIIRHKHVEKIGTGPAMTEGSANCCRMGFKRVDHTSLSIPDSFHELIEPSMHAANA
jgi:hypothetical protein